MPPKNNTKGTKPNIPVTPTVSGFDPFYIKLLENQRKNNINAEGILFERIVIKALKRWFISIFKVKELPAGMLSSSIIDTLLDHGKGLFFKEETTGRFMFLPMRIQEHDINTKQFRKGSPTPNSSKVTKLQSQLVFNKELKFIPEDPKRSTCIPIYLNYYGDSLIDLIKPLLTSLQKIWQAHDTNLVNSVTSMIIPVLPGQETQKMLELNQFWNNLNAWKVIPTANAQQLKDMMNGQIGQPMLTNNVNDAVNIWFDLDKIKKLIYEFIGIPYSGQEKKAQEGTDQALIDHFKSSALMNEMLESLNQWMTALNKLYEFDKKVEIVFNDRIKPLMLEFTPSLIKEEMQRMEDEGIKKE